MAVQLFENNSSSTLLTAIGASDTQLQIQAGDGAKYPTISSTDQFFVCALEDENGNVEIVTVTGKTGDTFTVSRGKEGTTAQPFDAGDRFELRVTAETLQNFAQKGGDTFTGIMRAPGWDLLPLDPANAWNPITYRFIDDGGTPTQVVAGPTDLAVAMKFSTFKAAGETYDWGIGTNGTFYTPGEVRWNWFEAAGSDPEWWIDARTNKPESDHIRLTFKPKADASKVSYRFICKDAVGNDNNIDFNPDGSISASGDFTLGGVVLQYVDDPDAERIKIDYKQGTLFFSPNQRTITFNIDNLDGNVGSPGSPAPGTAVQYFLPTRDEEGNAGSVSIYPSGALWSTGELVATKALVSTQGAPETLAPNELITKQYFEANGGGGTGSSNYFSENLYDDPIGVGQGSTISLDNPLITTGPPQVVHYQQVIVEVYFPNAETAPAYANIVLDVQTMRLGTSYLIDASGTPDATGNLQVRFPDYDSFTVQTATQGAVVRRITAISFAGDPFPAP